jgi:sugar lactone lactonase YvrE
MLKKHLPSRILFPFFSLLFLLSVNADAQVVYTIAGNGIAGNAGDSIVATRAEMSTPTGICFDMQGNLIVVETRNSRVRKIDLSNGQITTIAGTGVDGYAGDGGPAILAQFNDPFKVAIDSQDNIYILDHQNYCVRKIDPITSIITTVAGTGLGGFSGDGGPATLARLFVPMDIALDKLGNLYIADFINFRVRKVDRSTGIISTVAGSGIDGFNGDGIPALSANISPISIAIDSSGDMYISDFHSNRIRKIDAVSGIISTIAGNGVQGDSGDGGMASDALMKSVTSLRLDKQHNLYFCDQVNNSIRKIDFSTNIITKVAGLGILGYNGDGNAPEQTMFDHPQNCVVSDSNEIFIADTDNHRVRKIDFSCYDIECANVYTFTGDGEWSNVNNWYNNQLPPSPLPKNSKIIIDPVPNGQCILNIEQALIYGSHFIVRQNKHIVINGSLSLQ